MAKLEFLMVTSQQFTGWWFQPLANIWKSVGMIIPNVWNKKKSSKPPNKQQFIFSSLRFARQVATRSTTATATAATTTAASTAATATKASAAAAATWQHTSLWRKYVISGKDHGGTQHIFSLQGLKHIQPEK